MVLMMLHDYRKAAKNACGLYGTGGFGGKQALVLYTDDVRKFIHQQKNFTLYSVNSHNIVDNFMP